MKSFDLVVKVLTERIRANHGHHRPARPGALPSSVPSRPAVGAARLDRVTTRRQPKTTRPYRVTPTMWGVEPPQSPPPPPPITAPKPQSIPAHATPQRPAGSGSTRLPEVNRLPTPRGLLST